MDYMIDAAQRGVLFWGCHGASAGNQYRVTDKETAPHVLQYNVELVVVLQVTWVTCQLCAGLGGRAHGKCWKSI